MPAPGWSSCTPLPRAYSLCHQTPVNMNASQFARYVCASVWGRACTLVGTVGVQSTCPSIHTTLLHNLLLLSHTQTLRPAALMRPTRENWRTSAVSSRRIKSPAACLLEFRRLPIGSFNFCGSRRGSNSERDTFAEQRDMCCASMTTQRSLRNPDTSNQAVSMHSSESR